MRIIAFKIWGDFAHFRRHFTTSSPLTHSLPPPSALRGLIGAIVGLGSDKYPDALSQDKCQIGVRLLKPLKKLRLPLNYLDTKDGAWVVKAPKGRLHTQVRVEFLKNPAFEVFFHHEDYSFMDKLSYRLKNHQTVFTPYLGLSECLANFEFLWDEIVKPREETSRVVSVFPTESLEELKLHNGTLLLKEMVPVFIDSERRRHLSKEVIFHPHAKAIQAKLKEAFAYPHKEGYAFTFIG